MILKTMTLKDEESSSSMKINSENHLSHFLKDKSEISSFIHSFDNEAFFKNAADSDCFEIKVCMEELLVNIFNYGYSELDRSPRVEVSICKKNGFFILEIIDNAAPFNPLTENYEPILKENLKTRRIGGVGIHLVKELSDEFQYYPTVSGNRVVIKKKFTK